MEEHKKFGSTDFLMLLAVVFWAINFSFIKIALREFSPNGFNGIRLFLASLILIFVLWLRGEGFSMEKSDILKLIVISMIGNTVYQMLFIHGINLTAASTTSLILAMHPIFVALLSSCLKQERIHWAGWVGIFVSFIGFYFVITQQAGSLHFSWQSLKGDLMLLSGNMCWAIYTVFSKPILDKVSPLKLTAITLAIGTFFYLPFAANDIAHIAWKKISWEAWASLFYSTLFAIVISFVIWYASVKRVGNSKTSIYGNISPVFTAFFAYLFISEKITLFQILGALIIFAGFYLTRSGYRFFERQAINKKN